MRGIWGPPNPPAPDIFWAYNKGEDFVSTMTFSTGGSSIFTYCLVVTGTLLITSYSPPPKSCYEFIVGFVFFLLILRALSVLTLISVFYGYFGMFGNLTAYSLMGAYSVCLKFYTLGWVDCDGASCECWVNFFGLDLKKSSSYWSSNKLLFLLLWEVCFGALIVGRGGSFWTYSLTNCYFFLFYSSWSNNFLCSSAFLYYYCFLSC